MSFFTNYPADPGYKTVAPETSKAAAEVMKSRAETLREKCLLVLDSKECTADELARILGETVLAVRPRVSELNKMGKIEDAGKRRANESGVKAAVWKIKKNVSFAEL